MIANLVLRMWFPILSETIEPHIHKSLAGYAEYYYILSTNPCFPKYFLLFRMLHSFEKVHLDLMNEDFLCSSHMYVIGLKRSLFSFFELSRAYKITRMESGLEFRNSPLFHLHECFLSVPHHTEEALYADYCAMAAEAIDLNFLK